MFSEQSLTNASHITTFCTAVDVYRPLYGILENVVNMASTRAGLEEQNVLSQLVACLVSMGYQVNQYIMDSWTYGSCQQRSRIILTIAAPGLEPILQRPHTHSRSYVDTKARSLGKLRPRTYRILEMVTFRHAFVSRITASPLTCSARSGLFLSAYQETRQAAAIQKPYS
jgi:site-specific DNA-cytosine methylase